MLMASAPVNVIRVPVLSPVAVEDGATEALGATLADGLAVAVARGVTLL
jgi:hypothetical protein